MQTEEQLPGLTLRRESSTQLPPVPGSKFKASTRIVLIASINDFDIYEAVLQKLSELRVYTIENLAEEMIDVAQKRAGEAKQKADKEIEQSRIEAENSKQQLSFAQAELAQVRAQNLQLQQQIKHYEFSLRLGTEAMERMNAKLQKALLRK